ncbi:MAG: hypothetical protein RLZZ501_519 [Pseudomonadota bacterium]
MSSLRLAVFDVDGTLIDSQDTIQAAMTLAWSRFDLGPPPPEQVRRIIGLSLPDACAVLLPDAPAETWRGVAEAYKASFHQLRLRPGHHDPLFPGAREALDRLEDEGWLLGLATGKSRRGVEAMLDAHDLHGRFVTIQTADDNPGKPAPGMLLRAAAECGIEAGRMAMIGDTAYDMQMAKAAGAAAIGVSWGYHPVEELREAGAGVILDGFDALARALDATMGEA